MTRAPLPLTLPELPEPAAPPRAGHAWLALRQRWACMGPRCQDRNSLRALWKLPSRVQLQQGWCCSPDCVQTALEHLAGQLLRAGRPSAPRAHRIPLGLLLLSRGAIEQMQLRRALEARQTEGGRIGEWLVRQGAASEDTIAAGVGLQWARPIYPLAHSQTWRQCRGWAPRALLETLRMLPLHLAAAQRRLYVGFTQTVDYSALAALSAIYECETEACIVTDSALDAVFEQMRTADDDPAVQEADFEKMSGAAEIAGIVRQYARYAEARQIRLAPAGPFLWVRIRGERVVHLTFRVS
jgi:hypothetical protein